MNQGALAAKKVVNNRFLFSASAAVAGGVAGGVGWPIWLLLSLPFWWVLALSFVDGWRPQPISIKTRCLTMRCVEGDEIEIEVVVVTEESVPWLLLELVRSPLRLRVAT